MQWVDLAKKITEARFRVNLHNHKQNLILLSKFNILNKSLVFFFFSIQINKLRPHFLKYENLEILLQL